MTTDDDAAVQSATNAPPARVNGNPGGRGIPRGRNQCSGCGAEGVNIRTCPGDGTPHLATTEYREQVAQGDRPEPVTAAFIASVGEAMAEALDDALDDAQEVPDEVLQDDTPQVESWGALERIGVIAEGDPAYGPETGLVQVCTVTVKIVTTHPYLAAARLESFIDPLDDCLWVETTIRELNENDC